MSVNQAKHWLMKAPDLSFKGSMGSFACYRGFSISWDEDCMELWKWLGRERVVQWLVGGEMLLGSLKKGFSIIKSLLTQPTSLFF